MSDHSACQKLVQSLSEYIDGSLSEKLCQELEQHLQGCENCRVVLDTTRKTIHLYQVTAESGDLPGEVRQRLFKSLNLDDYVKPSA